MNKVKQNTIILTRVDSSNNYAIRMINSGKAVHGTVVLALCQENGRGRGGSTWESAAGMNLLASIIIFPDFLSAENQFYLSKITSLALIDLLSKEIDGITIKWPNDIFVGEQKIAGILIENMIRGNYLEASVIGIGLNLNQTHYSPTLPNPVSLKLLTGKDYIIEDVMNSLIKRFFFWYDKLRVGKLEEIDNVYYENLFRKNIWSFFKKGDEVIEGRISGIGAFGQLIIEERSGILSEYMFKEIEFVI
jgi:BirA family transcriptional regulator, biotin operon repressor / biotin---[acetyl-CoA-carboxylase] ligase